MVEDKQRMAQWCHQGDLKDKSRWSGVKHTTQVECGEWRSPQDETAVSISIALAGYEWRWKRAGAAAGHELLFLIHSLIVFQTQTLKELCLTLHSWRVKQSLNQSETDTWHDWCMIIINIMVSSGQRPRIVSLYQPTWPVPQSSLTSCSPPVDVLWGNSQPDGT